MKYNQSNQILKSFVNLEILRLDVFVNPLKIIYRSDSPPPPRKL